MRNKSIILGIFSAFFFVVLLGCFKTMLFSQAGIDKIREYNKAGDIDKAITAAKEYLSVNPREAEALTILGENYGKRKDFLLAEKALKEAVQIQPKNPWSIRALAAIYRMQAQETKSVDFKASYLALAVAKIEEALRLFRNDPWVNREAAEIYLEKGDKLRAKECIAKTLMMEPIDKLAKSLEKKILAMP
jgi:cytochrome c-type biogenesis protein CcmH/NrfG